MNLTLEWRFYSVQQFNWAVWIIYLTINLSLQSLINGDASDDKERTLLEQELETDNTLLSVNPHDAHQPRWATITGANKILPTSYSGYSLKWVWKAQAWVVEIRWINHYYPVESSLTCE